jgi:hypothetical protein
MSQQLQASTLVDKTTNSKDEIAEYSSYTQQKYDNPRYQGET